MQLLSKSRILNCGVQINFKRMEGDHYEEQKPQKRPVSLTVVCICTFIYTGTTILMSLLVPVLSDALVEVMSMPQFANERNPEVIRIIQAGWGYYLLILLVTSVSLTGALMMWNLRKNGFHLYTIANIILLYLPVIWFDFSLNIAEVFFTGIFIAYYAMHLKYMK